MWHESYAENVVQTKQLLFHSLRENISQPVLMDTNLHTHRQKDTDINRLNIFSHKDSHTQKIFSHKEKHRDRPTHTHRHTKYSLTLRWCSFSYFILTVASEWTRGWRIYVQNMFIFRAFFVCLRLCICVCVRLSRSLFISVCLLWDSLYVCVCLCVSLYVCLSICLFLWLYMCLFVSPLCVFSVTREHVYIFARRTFVPVWQERVMVYKPLFWEIREICINKRKLFPEFWGIKRVRK